MPTHPKDLPADEPPAGDHSGQASAAETLFARFLAMREAASAGEGPAPDFEAWVAAHPELEGELRQLESDWRGFDALLEGALGAGDTLFHRTPTGSSRRASFVEFEPGRVVGDFELVKRIGQGGMGEVWEAHQASLDRLVALKFIRPDKLTERAEAYFDREARAGGRLSHPGIVAVHATGRDGDLHWIAQELVPGSSTLRDFLKAADEASTLPPNYFDRVARFVAELCDALHVAHQASVIHRDIKPHNILITAEDRPKLTDFGLARLTDEAAFSGSYALKGTPIYMSPEQVLGKTKLIDHRSDLFSTGAVLFEMLTLRRPFEGDSEEVLSRILATEAPDPRELRADVPTELGAIALKALERRPSDRYRSAADMADDLRRYLHHEPVHARPAGPLRRAIKWCRRHPTLSSASALLLVLVGTTWTLRDDVVEASRGRVAAEQEHLLVRAGRAIDSGDIDRGAALLTDFDEAYPQDARGLLMLIGAYQRAMRLGEVEDVVGRYADRGFAAPLEARAAEPPSAADHFNEATHWRAMSAVGDPRVTEHLTQAIELDPDYEFALFPLYMSYLTRGEVEAAEQALRDFRGTMRTSDPMLPMVDALLAEAEGRYELAVERMRAVRAASTAQAFARVRGPDALGRMLLKLYMANPLAHAETLAEAEAVLQHAIETTPNFSALANLATVQLRKHHGETDPSRRAALLEAALDYAKRSLEGNSTEVAALEVVAVAHRCQLNLAVEADRERLLGQLETDLERLRQVDADSEALAATRSDLDFELGMAALDTDRPRALELFRRSTEGFELQLNGRVMLGQLLYTDVRDLEAAHATLLEALAVLRERDRRGADTSPRWRFALNVWLVGTGDRVGDLDTALDATLAAADQALEGDVPGRGVELSEVATLAEFLAGPEHPELRDCGLVRDLLNAYPVVETYAGGPHQWVIDAILGGCP